MLRNRRQFRATLESLEGKALMSNLPVLTSNALGQVVRQIDRAAGTYARTHNENAFLNSLSQISYKVPYGHSQLLPIWQSDAAIYDPAVRGSGTAMVRQLKADLILYVRDSVAQGMFSTGSGTSRPDPRTAFRASALPVLTVKTYNSVLRQIDRAAGTYAKTHNENVFLNSLAQISSKVPYGRGQLLPIWQSDLSIYDPGIRGSGTDMVRQLKADLVGYVQASVADGVFIVR